MLIGVLLAIISLVPLGFQFQLEADRRAVSQLELGKTVYYHQQSWGSIEELDGLEVLSEPTVVENEFATTVTYQVINHGRLEGKREVWAKIYSPENKLREGMKIWLELNPKGRNSLIFTFTGTAAEFSESRVELGF
jgi:hypothetical protein